MLLTAVRACNCTPQTPVFPCAWSWRECQARPGLATEPHASGVGHARTHTRTRGVTQLLCAHMAACTPGGSAVLRRTNACHVQLQARPNSLPLATHDTQTALHRLAMFLFTPAKGTARESSSDPHNVGLRDQQSSIARTSTARSARLQIQQSGTSRSLGPRDSTPARHLLRLPADVGLWTTYEEA